MDRISGRVVAPMAKVPAVQKGFLLDRGGNCSSNQFDHILF